jgi:hypothetical protein
MLTAADCVLRDVHRGGVELHGIENGPVGSRMETDADFGLGGYHYARESLRAFGAVHLLLTDCSVSSLYRPSVLCPRSVLHPRTMLCPRATFSSTTASNRAKLNVHLQCPLISQPY